MRNVFRLLVILPVVSLLVLSIAGCAPPWEGALHLIMTVDEPQNAATVNTSPVTVKGSVNKTAEVKINSAEVPVKGGKFSSTVILTEGQNTIRVVATSGDETVSTPLTLTYEPSKK